MRPLALKNTATGAASFCGTQPQTAPRTPANLAQNRENPGSGAGCIILLT